MFIDTSVIVAILCNEDDAAALAGRIEAAPVRLTLAPVLLEAAMRLSMTLGIDPVIVEQRIEAFLAVARIDVVALDKATASLAIATFARYGKRRGHPAQLDLADCLSYACAKRHAILLL